MWVLVLRLRFRVTVGLRVRDRVRVRARVWIVWYMDAQTAVRIHTDNSP